MATDSFPAIRFLAGLAFQSIHYAILNAQNGNTWHNRHVNHSQLETNIGLIASSFPSKTCTSRLILTSSDDVPGSGVA